MLKGRVFYKHREGDDRQWKALSYDGLPHPGWFYFYWPTYVTCYYKMA